MSSDVVNFTLYVINIQFITNKMLKITVEYCFKSLAVLIIHFSCHLFQ